jgi:hypothetical protein
VAVGQPNTRLAMMGRAFECAQFLKARIGRFNDAVASAKAMAKQVEENLRPRVTELEAVGSLLSWEERHENCTARITGQQVLVFDEYENTIARYSVKACPEYILAAAERVEVDEKSEKEKKGKPLAPEGAADATATDAAKAAQDAASGGEKDGKPSGKGKKGGKRRQMTLDEAAPHGAEDDAGSEEDPDDGDKADEEDEDSSESDAPKYTGARPRKKVAFTITGLVAALREILTEKAHVLSDDLYAAVEEYAGTEMPPSARAFVDKAIDKLVAEGFAVINNVDDRAAYARLVRKDNASKPDGAGAAPAEEVKPPSVNPKILRPVVSAAKKISGEKEDVVISVPKIVEETGLGRDDVEKALAVMAHKGDVVPTGKSGRGAGYYWRKARG